MYRLDVSFFNSSLDLVRVDDAYGTINDCLEHLASLITNYTGELENAYLVDCDGVTVLTHNFIA